MVAPASALGPGRRPRHTRFVRRRRSARAVAPLLAAPPGADRSRLCADYVGALLDPLAPRPGAWVEETPDNCSAAGFLLSLFEHDALGPRRPRRPRLACSFMRVPWAPDVFEPALEQWERGLLAAHRGTLELEPSRVHRLLLEDLLARDRDGAYRGLLAFLGLTDGAARRSFFERELTPDAPASVAGGSDLPPAQHARATAPLRRIARATARRGRAAPAARSSRGPGRGRADRLLDRPWAPAPRPPPRRHRSLVRPRRAA